jgi:autotransporter-associated beta strand protein
VQSGAEVVVDGINYSTAEALSIAGTGKGGAGALRATGTSTYAGAVTATAATTIAAGSGADFTISGALNAGGFTVTAGGDGNVLLSGAVTNGNITKTGAGSLTISNASSSFGTLTTGTGTTAFGANATATGLVGSGALSLASGTFTLNNSTAQTFSGAISGSGGFVKTGAATLTLSGNSTYSGATTVTNGTLVVNGALNGSSVAVGNASTANGSVLMGSGSVGATTINNNGRISPGNSVGTLSVSNSLSFNNGGSYLWEINGTNGPAGTAWDLITVDTTTVGDGLGTLNLPGSGQFTVNGLAIDSFTFDGNQDYTNNYFLIVEAAGITGSTANLAFLGAGLGSGSWFFSTNATGLFLNYTAALGNITFTNSSIAFQGDADIANPAGPWGVIDQSYAVEVTGGGTVIMTNADNSYTGTTTIKNGGLRADVNAPNNANGAFGNAITAIAVGNDTGSANATLDIGVDGVTIGRAVQVVAGSSGTKTLGTSLSSGTATYSGAVDLATSATLTAGGTANAVFSGQISGAGGITKSGNGTVTLSGGAGNSFTGTTTVSAGTLLLNKTSGNALATNATVNTGGTLLLGAANQIANTATVTLGGGTFDLGGFTDQIGTLQLNSGSLTNGTLTATTYNLAGGTVAGNLGTGTINASADAALNGTAAATTVNITGGTLTLGSASRLIGTTPAVNLSGGGALALGGNESIGALRLTNGTVGGSGTLTVGSTIDAQQGAVSANLAGSVGLTKTTANTVTLSGANTFSGAVAVNDGTLILTNGSALANTAAVTLANTAGVTLQIDSNETIGSLASVASSAGAVALGANTLTLNQSGDTTYGGTITGTGSLVKSGAGTFTLNRSTAVGADFDVSVVGGTFELSRGGSALSGILGSGNKVFLDGGTVEFSASSGGNGDIAFGGIDVRANSAVLINRTTSANNHSSVINAPLTFTNNATLSMLYGATVSGGTTTFSGTGGHTLFSNGTLQLGLYGVTISTAIGESGGSYSFTKTGSGLLTLSAANTYTGSTIVGEGTVALSGSGRLADASLLVVSNGATMNFAGISDTIRGMSGAGSVTLGSGTLTSSNTATDTFSGSVTGTGAFVKQGEGTQVLTGANTYSGGTLVSAGALAGSTTGLQGAITNNAALIFDQSGSGTFAGTLSGSGSLIKTNAGTVIFTNSASQSGVSIAQGTLQIGSGGAAGSLSGAITNDGTLAFNRSGLLTHSGNITGGGSVTKSGTGTVTLSGNNSYSGGTTISAGGLAGNATSLQGSIVNDASVIFDQAGTGTFAGNVSGSGALIKTNTGTLIVTNTISQTGVTVAQGTLQVGDGGSTGSIAGAITNNGTLAFNRAGNSTVSGAITGTGSVTKTGTGTITLTATNSYAGGTTINGGAVQVTGPNRLGDVNGTLTINDGKLLVSTSGISSGRDIVLGSANSTVEVDSGIGYTATSAALLSGSGALNKAGAGSLTLSGGNSFTGATVVSGGVLNLNSATGGAIGSTSSVSVASGATLLLSTGGNVSDTATVTLSGGTISRGSGVSEVFGSLNLTDASFLDFGTGDTGNLTFGTYQDNQAPSALLTLNNFLPGNSFTFSSTTFSAGSIGSYFTFGTGFRDYSLSSTGSTFTITAIPEPSTYLAAAGLLSLMLWPSRKRLLKDAKRILGLRAPMRDRLAARSKA